MPDKAQVRASRPSWSCASTTSRTARKSASCQGDYKELVRATAPIRSVGRCATRPAACSRHSGIANYTIGQRQGLGIAVEPAGLRHEARRFEQRRHARSRGPAERRAGGGEGELVDRPPAVGQPRPADIKVRYMHKPAAGFITVLPGGEVERSMNRNPR